MSWIYIALFMISKALYILAIIPSQRNDALVVDRYMCSHSCPEADNLHQWALGLATPLLHSHSYGLKSLAQRHNDRL